MTTPRVVLVPCGSSKRAVASAAKDLYVSTPFREARRFAERYGDVWMILSALHGLLDPDDVIDPYEKTLNEMPIAERRVWADSVNAKLLAILPAGARVTILAGKKYREFVEPFLRMRGFHVETPLARFGIGQQVQWLQNANTSGHLEDK